MNGGAKGGAGSYRSLDKKLKTGDTEKGENMELTYTYEKGEKYLVGHLDDYPEYPTQGEDINDLEEHLKDIFRLIQDGTLEPKYHGTLKIA